MEVLVIFTFLLQTHPIFRKSLVFMFAQKLYLPIRLQDFSNFKLNHNPDFFSCYKTLLEPTNSFSLSAQVWSDMANLSLNQSDSKILEILITQEKFEQLSWSFAFGHISTGVTNQCSLRLCNQDYSQTWPVPLNNISKR